MKTKYNVLTKAALATVVLAAVAASTELRAQMPGGALETTQQMNKQLLEQNKQLLEEIKKQTTQTRENTGAKEDAKEGIGGILSQVEKLKEFEKKFKEIQGKLGDFSNIVNGKGGKDFEKLFGKYMKLEGTGDAQSGKTESGGYQEFQAKAQIHESQTKSSEKLDELKEQISEEQKKAAEKTDGTVVGGIAVVAQQVKLGTDQVVATQEKTNVLLKEQNERDIVRDAAEIQSRNQMQTNTLTVANEWSKYNK